MNNVASTHSLISGNKWSEKNTLQITGWTNSFYNDIKKESRTNSSNIEQLTIRHTSIVLN